MLVLSAVSLSDSRDSGKPPEEAVESVSDPLLSKLTEGKLMYVRGCWYSANLSLPLPSACALTVPKITGSPTISEVFSKGDAAALPLVVSSSSLAASDSSERPKSDHWPLVSSFSDTLEAVEMETVCRTWLMHDVPSAGAGGASNAERTIATMSGGSDLELTLCVKR
jgi:hypothetical protein